jgi:uncharacterized protein (DUF305 family)
MGNLIPARSVLGPCGGELLREVSRKEKMQYIALVSIAVLLSVPAVADSPAPTSPAAKYEIKFMKDMIDHHTMAIMTAETCVTKAIHEDLRELCQDIVTAQMQEVALMQSWLEKWYGISYTAEMKPGMMRQAEKFNQLSGAEFEIEFMKDMIRHHYGAVIEGAHCMQRAYHYELKTMCENIVASQTQEISLMRRWLGEWYGIYNWGPKGLTK